MFDLWDSLGDPISGAGLARAAAQSKRPSLQAESPVQQPMRAGQRPAQQRKPTGDQKKHRRQMRRQASVGTCPECGSEDLETYEDPKDTGLYDQCLGCGFIFDAQTGSQYDPPWTPGTHRASASTSTPSTPTKESTAMTEQQNTPTEADLLQRLASAPTLAEQTEAASALAEFRDNQRHASTGMEFDWGNLGEAGPSLVDQRAAHYTAGLTSTASYSDISDRLPHATAAERLGHTDATDWMMDLAPATHDDQAMTTAMRAQASHWYQHEVYAPVKQVPSELKVQAYNAGVRAGTQFGLHREAAASVFVTQVAHLASREGIDIHATQHLSEWGTDSFDSKGPDPTVPTYVSDGHPGTLPLGVDPAKADTHDDGTEHGPNVKDPKTDPNAGDQKSLSEGTAPEHGSSESPENPLTGDTSLDKSTYDKGAPTDRMNTQSATAAKDGERAACKNCDQDIENVKGKGWWDRGGNYSCDKGGKHTPYRESSLHTAADSDRSAGYLGKKPNTGDHVPAEPGAKDRMCLAEAKGAIGDCVRPKGHDGFHQGAQNESWNDEFSATNSRHYQGSLRTADVTIKPYSGPVKDCTAGACSHTPEFVAQKDGSNEPGENQVACRAHIGDVAGNMAKASSLATREASLFEAAASIFAENTTQGIQTHADALPSNWGEGVGIDEGTEPEHGHSESPVQDTPSGDLDKSSPTDADRSVNWGDAGGAAKSQDGAYTASLSVNARAFVAALSTVGSLDEQVAGVSARQIAALALADPTVPEAAKRVLKAGGNPFAREALTASGDAGKCPKCGSTDTFVQGDHNGCHACAYSWSSKTSRHMTEEEREEAQAEYDEENPDLETQVSRRRASTEHEAGEGLRMPMICPNGHTWVKKAMYGGETCKKCGQQGKANWKSKTSADRNPNGLKPGDHVLYKGEEVVVDEVMDAESGPHVVVRYLDSNNTSLVWAVDLKKVGSLQTQAGRHDDCDHRNGYCEDLKRRNRRNDFSISDAKNEDGEWTMSPEQIRSEMAYGDEQDPDDFYDRYSSLRTTAYGIVCPLCAYYGALYCRETVGTCDRCHTPNTDVDMDYSETGDREKPNQTLCLDCLDLPDVHFKAAHTPHATAEFEEFKARRQGSLQTTAVAWGRRHYEDLAASISTLPDGEREKAAKHFAQGLSGTNPHYRPEQFERAASTRGYQVRGGTGNANYSRGHYQAVADLVKSYPGDKAALSKTLSDHFGSSNMAFKPDRFNKATASMAMPRIDLSTIAFRL